MSDSGAHPPGAPTIRPVTAAFVVGEHGGFRRLVEPQWGLDSRLPEGSAQLLQADKKGAHFTQRVRLI
jgi:hypothetical protein